MPEVLATCLVEQLRGIQLRIRTGLLILPSIWLGRESDIATLLGIDCQDLCRWILEKTPKGRKIIGLKVENIIENLTLILNENILIGSCVLVSNIDYILAGLSYSDRIRFWDFMRNSFRRDRGLIISFPIDSTNLLPVEEFSKWEDLERLAIWEVE
jgi:hypothetical protein